MKIADLARQGIRRPQSIAELINDAPRFEVNLRPERFADPVERKIVEAAQKAVLGARSAHLRRLIDKFSGLQIPGGMKSYLRQVAKSMSWDERLLQDTSGIESAASQSGMKSSELLAFLSKHCQPANWQAMFWAGQYYAATERRYQADEIARESLIRNLDRFREKKEAIVEAATRHALSKRAKAAADARYQQPGGYAAKKAFLIAEYRKGGYRGHTDCARRNLTSLGVELRTAAGWLKGEPKPGK